MATAPRDWGDPETVLKFLRSCRNHGAFDEGVRMALKHHVEALLPRKTDAKTTAFNALRILAEHPCVHPPECGHRKFSECRNALASAISGSWELVRHEAEGRDGT